jgi:hypothetical protein
MKVTKWSTCSGDLTVNEQKAEPTSGETGSLNSGPAALNSSEAPQEQLATSAPEISVVKSPGIAADAPQAEAPKPDAAKADAPRSPGKVLIMSAANRNWDSAGAGSEMESESSQGLFGNRRLSALAAVVALAVMAGALGGALVTASLSQVAGDGGTGAANAALEASVARIDADILALKANVDHGSKLDLAQYNKTSDRLDKVEKTQAEPLAKLARLSEAVDKLRAAPVAPATVAAAPVAAKEVTGSIPTPPAAPVAAPKVEVARLPTVEGWVLRDIANGSALIEGRRGMFEVYAGDSIPGIGRVEAIRRQDGRWVVVTSKGLIVAR